MVNLFDFIIPYWKKGMVPMILLLITGGLSLLYPLFPKWVIDEVMSGKDIKRISYLILLFFIVLIFSQIFSYVERITFFKFQKESILDIQRRVLEKVVKYPMEYFDKNHSGYLTGRIRGDVEGLSYIFSEGLIVLITDFIKFFGSILILIGLNLKLTLICLLILPFLIIKIIISRGKIEEVNKKILEENARVSEELSDVFQGIEVIKTHSKEEEGIKRAYKGLKKYRKTEVERNIVVSKYSLYIEFFINTGNILLLYFGMKEIISGNLSIGGYVAFTGYLMYLYSPIKNISYSSIYIDYAKKSYKRIKELFDILPEDSGNYKINKIEKVEVKNVSFYFLESKRIIENLSFSISKGDRVVIRGRSGSGKSTLVKLMLGLYRVNKGSIKYNGVDIKELDLKILRERIGFVSQNIFLFNRSIRENITLGKNISDKKLYEVLKICKLKEKIENLDGGVEYELSEKGYNFSGGERQRIALARALVKEPDMVILDEATSNIDKKTAKEIEDFIVEEFKEKIIIKITHREEKNSMDWKVIEID